jgi:hypothetical protein
MQQASRISGPLAYRRRRLTIVDVIEEDAKRINAGASSGSSRQRVRIRAPVTLTRDTSGALWWVRRSGSVNSPYRARLYSRLLRASEKRQRKPQRETSQEHMFIVNNAGPLYCRRGSKLCLRRNPSEMLIFVVNRLPLLMAVLLYPARRPYKRLLDRAVS